ncbi:MAG: hypothetical protein D3913_09150 [Candidatus Electrothrix sp. LOE1_4_5]|nr:hypothetical protein [Candidatus Electrothrix gigas]
MGVLLLKVSELLNNSQTILAAAPKINVDYKKSSYIVKLFYRVWTELPYFSQGDMIGSGIYALSKKGRERFDIFPDIIGDDTFVRLLFSPQERVTVYESSFLIFAPLNFQGLLKIKTRSYKGRKELQSKYPEMTHDNDTNLFSVIKLLFRKNRLFLPVIIYFVISCIVRINTLRKSDFHIWERDESSRTLCK